MLKIIKTEDGSSSVYHEELNETYHSTRGALAESQHIYINAGLKYLLENGEKHIRIFEMGFGTGLNAILTYKEWLKYPEVIINYTAIEKYPLDELTVSQLVFEGISDNREIYEAFTLMHGLDWGQVVKLAEGFTFLKSEADIHNYRHMDTYNLVYYDAFAPSKQPDVWKFEVLEKLSAALKPGAVLVTYCAGGQFKRDLKQLDFDVQSLQGPAGKKEITRAVFI